MSDKTVKPKSTSDLRVKGEDLARQAESGDLSAVIKELDTFRKQNPSQYNELLLNVQGANANNVNDDRRNVAAENQKRWFGADKKPTLPTLLFEDPDKDGKPNKLYGRMVIDGADTARPQEAKPQAVTRPEAKPTGRNNGETMIMLNPNSERTADWVYRQMQKTK